MTTTHSVRARAWAHTRDGRYVEVLSRVAFIVRMGGDTTVFDVEVEGEHLGHGSHENLDDAKRFAEAALTEILMWTDNP